MYVSVYAYVCMCVYVCVSVYLCMRVCACLCVYVYGMVCMMCVCKMLIETLHR